MTDTQGLFLEVAPNGSKWWRLRYFINGKEKLMSLGVYPQVSLKMACQRRDEARRLIATGEDPRQVMETPHEEESGVHLVSFSTVAQQWFDFKSKNWTPRHAHEMRLRLNKCVSCIPGKPFNELELDDFLPFLKEVVREGNMCSAADMPKYAHKFVNMAEF